jgi:uncharacterized membrane protein
MATKKKSTNTDLKKKLTAAQARVPGLNEDLNFLLAVNEKRNKNAHVITPLPYHSYTSDGDDGTRMLALPGTLRIFIAEASSPLLKKLKAACKDNNAAAQEAIMKSIADVMIARKLTSRKKAQKMILDTDNMFTLTCGKKTILDGGFLPYGDSITYMDIPYCGTPFPQHFPPLPPIDLDDWCGTGPKPRPRLDGFVVVHEPRLSPAAMAALKLIPESNREILIGGSTVAIGTSIWYASAVAALALVVMTVVAGCKSPLALRDIYIRESDIEKLGPMRTAAQLLALREKAMLGKAVSR